MARKLKKLTKKIRKTSKDRTATKKASAQEIPYNGEGEDGNNEKGDLKVYIPGMTLEEGEELEADPSAYYMLHSLTTEWPCLSFDILRHGAPNSQHVKYPQTAWIVAGTQADSSASNRLYLMRWSGLSRTGGFTEEEETEMLENDEEPEECRGEPVMDIVEMAHLGGCNRIRTCQQDNQSFVASWSDSGKVFIYDVTSSISSFVPGKATVSPMFTVTGHSTEGYALAWSPFNRSLLSGDCSGGILLTGQTGQSKRFLNPSGLSVEDLQWSPSDESIFASCSVDQAVRLWDERTGQSTFSWKLHESDINVMSWNKNMSFLLATGADDGTMRVWDLRMLTANASTPSPVASFAWHQSAITSLEWHPTDSSVIAACGADHQLTIWDLAVERDTQQLVQDGGKVEDEVQDIPPQLLFIHQGQSDLKELHWHPQLPGTIVSTAADSFNIFRTISV